VNFQPRATFQKNSEIPFENQNFDFEQIEPYCFKLVDNNKEVVCVAYLITKDHLILRTTDKKFLTKLKKSQLSLQKSNYLVSTAHYKKPKKLPYIFFKNFPKENLTIIKLEKVKLC
jgi:hypothetical protein